MSNISKSPMVLTQDLRDLLMDLQEKCGQRANKYDRRAQTSNSDSTAAHYLAIAVAVGEVQVALLELIKENFPNQKPQTEAPCQPESKD